MKIRFTIEIKGCTWEDKGWLLSCPYMTIPTDYDPFAKDGSMTTCCYGGKARNLPTLGNPAWCPMMQKEHALHGRPFNMTKIG